MQEAGDFDDLLVGMDASEFGSYAGIVSCALLVAGSIYGAVNHKQIRSKCCGKRLEASLDIGPSEPSPTRNQNVPEHLPVAITV
jgi:hypothetical protein